MGQRTTGRDRMITGAMRLFREYGVAGTSLADVVEHSEAPRGSIYHYFPGGKAQLAEEATAHAGRLMGATISALVAAEGPVKALNLVVEHFRKDLVESDFTAVCPVLAGALDGGESPAAREVAGEAFSSWEATLSAALWQHGIPARRADRMATTAISAIEGALVLARAQRSTRPLDRVAEALAEQVGALLTASETQP
ncbi:TetR/AcrR family transcriptional regulator [Amycolatopsis anabasis]|uniref:TetR/AcrR family transcriptional regulator n=1 Tax=Amycolatopsis anabasis TaxID=1840409 RepID=UPI001C5504E8|nr:TetR/AcrR family transcriptional regulator [Amycolatopsis anabasis]